MRAYVNSAARIFGRYGGEVRSFDGDRVQAIFVGDDKNTRAVRAALAINWAVAEVIKPGIAERWNDVAGQAYNIGHGIGIDTGEALIVRGGARAHSDLISVGSAPNVAAKFSTIRTSLGSIFITQAVFDDMDQSVATDPETNRSMWGRAGFLNVGGTNYSVLRSSWHWEP